MKRTSKDKAFTAYLDERPELKRYWMSLLQQQADVQFIFEKHRIVSERNKIIEASERDNT